MHYYKRNLGDYAKKAGKLTMLQHGSYTLLIDACYDREQFPMLDQAIEWTWATTEDEINAVKFVLDRFFRLDKDGQYIQPRILEELLDYHKKADKNKEIAIEREAKRKQYSTNRAQVVNEASPNHKPRTKNQDIKEPKGSSSTSLPPCPHGEILVLFSKHCPTLPQPRPELWKTSKNAKALSERWKWILTASKANGEPYAANADEAVAWLGRYFGYVNECDFLTGKSTNWSADLGWLVNKSNFEKVLQGNYKNKDEK
jgi:uncharacterized protein YdaU (DUF1376 family)